MVVLLRRLKADAFEPDRRERFATLRRRYLPLAVTNFAFHQVVLDLLSDDESPMPSLPLRTSVHRPQGRKLEGLVPDDALDAVALRRLLDALIGHSRRATAEFNEIFGQRA